MKTLSINKVETPEPILPPAPGTCDKIGQNDFLLLTPNVKTISIGDSSITFKMTIKNPRYLPSADYSHIDIRSKPYLGFIVLFRENCGKKFLKTMANGKGPWSMDIMDVPPEQYSIQYLTLGKGKSRLVMQYRMDTVHTANNPVYRSSGVKNLKREDIQIVLRSTGTNSGLSDMVQCLENSQTGVMNYPESGGNEDFSDCIFINEKRAKRIRRKRWKMNKLF